MKNFLPVLKFHLKEGFRSKSFIITGIILFAAILGFFAFFHFYNDENKIEVSYINQTSNYVLEEDALNEAYPFIHFTEVPLEDLDEQKELVKESDVDGLLVFQEDANKPIIEYFFERSPNYELITVMQNNLQSQYSKHIAVKNEINEEVFHSLFEQITVENIALDDDKSAGIIYFFGYMMFMFILMFGQTVAMGVVGEKTTRVMEIMITKVHPITMMYAKIISSLLMGLGQIATILLAYITARLLGWSDGDNLNIFGMPMDLSLLNAEAIIYLIVYFILGYFLYTLLFASISSVVSRAEEVGSIIFPISMLLIAGFLLSIRVMISPTDTLVQISSYVPFFSPFVTFARIISGEAHLLEIGASIGLLALFIVLFSYFANRIYLNGVMNYQNKTTLKDVFKMAKQK